MNKNHVNSVSVALAQYNRLRSVVSYDILMKRAGASRKQIHHDAQKLQEVGAVRVVKGARGGYPSRVYPLVPASVFRALAVSQNANGVV